MKIKTNYQNTEFKERQESFYFFCEQAFDFLLQFKKDCRKGWYKLFSKKTVLSCFQESCDFSEKIKKLAEWTNWTKEKQFNLI